MTASKSLPARPSLESLRKQAKNSRATSPPVTPVPSHVRGCSCHMSTCH